MYAHLHDPPPSAVETAPGTPAGLDAVIERALAKDAGPALSLRGRPRPRRARGARRHRPVAAGAQPGHRSRRASGHRAVAGRPPTHPAPVPPPRHAPRRRRARGAPAPSARRGRAAADRGAWRCLPPAPWRGCSRLPGCSPGRRGRVLLRRPAARPARSRSPRWWPPSRRATARTASPWTATPCGWPIPREARSPGSTPERTGPPGSRCAVGRNPDSVAVTDGVVWVTNTDDGTVSRIEGGLPGVASCRWAPDPRACQPEIGLLWVANGDGDSVSRIDLASATPAGEPIGVGNKPIGIFAGSRYVWVTNSFSGTVSRIDPSTGEVVGQTAGSGEERAQRDRGARLRVGVQRGRRHGDPARPEVREGGGPADHGRGSPEGDGGGGRLPLGRERGQQLREPDRPGDGQDGRARRSRWAPRRWGSRPAPAPCG